MSEQILAKPVMAQLRPGTVVVGDRNFGVFSVAQAARQYGHQVILRMTSIRAMALAGRKMQTGEEITVRWTPARRVMFHAEMSQEPVEGRLIYKRLHPDGFRAIDLYLFTSLADASTDELVSLYGKRWNVELDLRYVKQTLDMAMLTSKSKDMVRKELAAGMCAYNLVRICMMQAGRTLMTVPRLLSFAKCRRRVSECIRSLARGATQVQALTILWIRLEGCFAQKRTRFRIEPRAVRRFPAVYPALKGSRAAARSAALNSYHAASKS